MFGSRWRQRIDANQRAIARNQAIIATNQVALHTKLLEVARLIESNSKIEGRKLEHIMSQADELVKVTGEIKAATTRVVTDIAAIEEKLANSPAKDDPVVAQVLQDLAAVRDTLSTTADAADKVINPTPPAGSGDGTQGSAS